MNIEARNFLNANKLIDNAAEFIFQCAKDAVKASSRFTFVLAGGNTPRGLYSRLSKPPYDSDFPWRETCIFFGDERCVSKDHPDSNFFMAHQTLISNVSIPESNIYRIPVEKESPEVVARDYEKTLRAFPTFDLILLGLGADGHIASLFPGDPKVEEQGKRVIDVYAPEGNPPGHRISLTLPAINSAKTVIFLVSGDSKQEIARKVIAAQREAREESVTYPAGRVKPEGRCMWFTDFDV
jgi:6-phosphogluconolactonase